MAFPLAELLLGAYEGDDVSGDVHRDAVRRSAREHAPDVHDAARVARLRAGDGAAYVQVIRAYYEWLHGVAMSYVASEVTAEEIVDGAFARMWERRVTLATETKLAPYLFVAVRHASLNWLKHEVTARRRLRLTESAETPPGMGEASPRSDVGVEQRDVTETVWRAVDTLSERARAIMILRWREQLDWDEIAEALTMSSAAVQMQHSRALKVLRERLPEYLAEG